MQQGIDAGAANVAAFYMTASLQGKFIDYDAKFEHTSDLGGAATSLIEGVEIHELNHIVNATGTNLDSRSDFLVNDVPETPSGAT